ncbi:ADP-ribose pyrophosphatase YjhB, NUDIX family [Tessaracoccus bendigoensis DSM 12906]|uniref:ADP-ribose pyrophosphatase YjhB, NUDIX family n=1 Tax=Tessaracoccus bendigoensis DSM 12906 TaxID=1123357 RepID=A0A1M6ACU6_9ACTN|nr:NUDIX domain-containing protein [Tessaracoccus bendigoensis]SHI34247.1 ADP-ribose pyrophosphatase YjhB, NUDIX family [Tessaracoccus bendigoensis DSM 12906]
MTRDQIRDADGVALYRHEAIAAVLQVRRVDDVERLTVLLSRRRDEPFAGLFALPSGAVETGEALDAAVLRHLAAKVDVSGVTHLEQLGTRSDPGRDPAQRTIATSYLGLVPTSSDPALPERARWEPVDALPALAFDHGIVVAEAVERLRAKLSYTNLGFALMPTEFTIAELREVYVAALGHDVAPTNLQRVLTRRGQLVPTGELSRAGTRGGRPARRFRFAEASLIVTDPFAVLRPEG